MGRNIEKNPFSLYDFLGHFIPGAMALILLFIIYQGFEEIKTGYFDISKFCDISTYANFINRISNYNIGIVFISFILASYISGNLISYLSSQSIEKILTRAFGYPSKYLLIKDFSKRSIFKEYFNVKNETGKWRKFSHIVLLSLILIFTFPICLFISICELSLQLTKYITNPLDDEIIKAIEKKEKLLSEKLLINDYKGIKDFHRVIMHYVYMNLEKSEVKTEN